MKDTNKTTDKPKRGRRSKKEILAATTAATQPNQVNEILDHSIVHELVPLVSVNELVHSLEQNQEQEQTLELEQVDESGPPEHVAKKRGRKPKGGKIIQQNILNNSQKDDKQNIILHLKCSLKDIENDEYNNNIESFNFNLSKT